MKGLGHLIKTIDDQIHFAALDIQKADIGGVHDIQRDAGRLFAQLVEDGWEQGGFGIITGHNAHDHLRVFGGKRRCRLHRAIHP